MARLLLIPTVIVTLAPVIASGEPWEQVLPYPPAVAAAVQARRAAEGTHRDRRRTTVFLNFDGATIHNGDDSDAATDTTWIAFTKGACANRQTVDLPPFDDSYWASHGSREQIIQTITASLAEVYAGYDIRFVTTRPASGHYTMTVVGGACATSTTLCQEAGVVGVSPVDCTDEDNLNLNADDVNFVCSDSIGSAGLDLLDLAYVIAHEDAHTFGLAHVDRADDIMYFILNSSDHRRWGQGALQAGATTCSATGTQDDAAYLLRAIGAAGLTADDPPAGPTRGCAIAPTARRAPAAALALLGLLGLGRRLRRPAARRTPGTWATP